MLSWDENEEGPRETGSSFDRKIASKGHEGEPLDLELSAHPSSVGANWWSWVGKDGDHGEDDNDNNTAMVKVIHNGKENSYI